MKIINTSRLIDNIMCIILLMLLVLYYSQDVIISVEGRIGSVIFITLILISGLYLIKLFLHRQGITILMATIFSFVIINFLYFILTADKIEELARFRQVLLNFLPFFPFYYFSKKGILTRKMLEVFFIVLLPILTIKFASTYGGVESLIEERRFADNAIYSFLGLLPFIFLFRRKYIGLLFLLGIWAVIIQSNKRAAIICGVFVMFLFIIRPIFSSTKKNRLKVYLSSILLFASVTYIAYDFYQQNLFLQTRMEKMMKGDSAGRDVIAKNTWRAWSDSESLKVYLFGYGFNSSKKFSKHTSHNDWLDMIVSFGVIGLISYILVWIAMTRELFIGKWNNDKKIIIYAILGIAFIVSMTSRWYLSPFPYMHVVLLPFILANRNDEL